MNFLKRGLVSIKRRLGKSIILLILIFVLGNIIAGAISIKQAVRNTEINFRKNIGAVATTELDYNKIQKISDFDYSSIKYITSEDINNIGSLEYVKYYDYSSSIGLRSTELKRYTSQDSTYYINSEGYQYIALSGVQFADILDFKEGKAKLTQGRVFNDEEIKSGKEVIIISNKFAELNNLTIGSTIKLENPAIKPMDDMGEGVVYYTEEYKEEILATQEVELEVIGIFEVTQEVKKSEDGMIDPSYIDEEKQNKIYTPNQVIKKLNNFLVTEISKVNKEQGEAYAKEYMTPIFVLNDPMDLEAFKEEALAYMPEYFKIVDSSDSYNQVATPMKNIEWISNIVLYVAIGATIIILSLLITLFLKDRKHEIGIYLSLGEKRKKIVAQIVLEVIIVAFVGITLSLFSGNVLANSMSKTMLRNQIVAEEEEKNSDGYYKSYSTLDWMGYGTSVSSDDLLENYKVELDLSTVLLFYAVGIGTVLGSTLIPIIYITRLNPKKVMM